MAVHDRSLGARAAALALVVCAGGTAPAHADLQLCNRTSYVLDLALGLEDKGAVATRGWFHVEPGQCRTVLAGAVEAERIYLHARAPALYGPTPMPQSGHADFCIGEDNFVIAGAKNCPRSGQRLVRFTAVQPSESDKGLTASLAEEAEYTPEQARFAGIQRLLVVAGYDANPIDGIEGKKTEAALGQFLKDRRLPADAAAAANFFDVLIEAVKQSDGIGFSWCNETAHTVMAALGVDDRGSTVARGWYRIEPGKCVKPELAGGTRRVYSFAEAIDKDGQAIRRADKALAWGGPTMLCTRNVRFEISEHTDCAGRGLTAAGFATVDLTGRGTTVRLKEP
jgi:uncharacterized membrane protein